MKKSVIIIAIVVLAVFSSVAFAAVPLYRSWTGSDHGDHGDHVSSVASHEYGHGHQGDDGGHKGDD